MHETVNSHQYNFRLTLIVATFFALFLSFFIITPRASAQAACSDLSTGYGTANYTLSGTQAGAQSLWIRIKGTDGNPTLKYNLSGGGSSCNQTITTSGATGWKWVKSSAIFTTTGGSVAVQLSATKVGVGVDCLVLTSDTNFLPTTTADCAGPQIDTTPPTLSFSAPANGATVSGTITVSANSADTESGIQNVTFSVAGNSGLDYIDSNAPYERTLNTTTIPNGSVQLTILARNGVGLTTTQTRTITVNNVAPPVPDTTKPIVTITSPTQNTIVSGGAVDIIVSATDNVAVGKVELFLDGVKNQTDTSIPYSFSLSGLSDGVHQIYAIATDTSNNTQQSATITFTSQTYKPGDVTGDGVVDLRDFTPIKANFGRSGMSRSQGDLDGNTEVNLLDFSILKINFGS